MNIISPIKNLFKPAVRTHNDLIKIDTATWRKVKFGYLEHDEFITQINKENINFNNSELKNAPLQDEVSVKKYFKQISDQYHLGSCVGNATADAIEAEKARKKNVSPEKINDLSRLFIYWNSRNNQRPPAANSDNGTYISLAFDSIKRYGVPDEIYWKYDINKVFDRPSPAAYAQGYINRINNYYSINSKGDNRISDVIRALSSGRSVVFGTRINDDFRKIKGEQIIDVPTSNFIGRHAMIIVGWSNSKKAFEIRNSWGQSWGNNGYTYFTPEYIKADITRDLFIATM